MPASRTWRMFGLRTLIAVFPLCAAAAARAQHPPLAPTTDTSIVVSGPLRYSSILVPVGVTVRFVLPVVWPPPFRPAVVLCDGDAIVHGTLSVAGGVRYVAPFTSAAGSVTTGRGGDGFSCASGRFWPPDGGRHAGTYGSVVPFSLDGGSIGGTMLFYNDPLCTQWASSVPGGEGGGTLVLLAAGRIEVDGAVTADGSGGLSGGSGGSVLLRGDGGVVVLPGGSVTARGGTAPTAPAPFPPQGGVGAPGYVRLDAWGAPPVIQSTLSPTPVVLELPYLRQQSQLRIGTTWILDVFVPENAPVFVAASVTPGTGTPTAFGPLGLDPATAAFVALAVAQAGHDPVASVPWAIPNAPALVNLPVWIQALAVPTALPARLTNTLAAVVQ